MRVDRVGILSMQGEKFSLSTERKFSTREADSLVTAAPSSCSGCITQLLCFVPNLVWSVVKQVIRTITFGCCCSDQPTEKAMQKNFEEVLRVWKDPDATDAEKLQAVRNLPSAVREEFLERYVDVKRSAQLGKKATREAIHAWNKKHADTVRQGAAERLDAQDISLVESYLAVTTDDNALDG